MSLQKVITKVKERPCLTFAFQFGEVLWPGFVIEARDIIRAFQSVPEFLTTNQNLRINACVVAAKDKVWIRIGLNFRTSWSWEKNKNTFKTTESEQKITFSIKGNECIIYVWRNFVWCLSYLFRPHPLLTRLRIYEGNYSLFVMCPRNLNLKNVLNTSENK